MVNPRVFFLQSNFEFLLAGDIIPEETIMGEFRLPNLDEFAEPAFDVRGLQPFHDFVY